MEALRLKANALKLLMCVLLLPLFAQADVNPKFARLRDDAEPLGNLSAFLDRYIGDCDSLFGNDECKANAAKFRKTATGKRFYMIVNEDEASMLSSGPYEPGKGIYTVQILPFFTGGQFALTHGAPKKQDANGNPVLPLLSVTGKTPIGWNALSIQSLFSRKQLRMQIVFTPEGIWTLPKKGGGKIEGVRANVEAILVTIGRTGEQVALWSSVDSRR